MLFVILATVYCIGFAIYLYATFSNYMYERMHKKLVKKHTNDVGKVDVDALDYERKNLIQSQLLANTLRCNEFSAANSAKVYRLERDYELNAIEYAEKYKDINNDAEDYNRVTLFIKIILTAIFIVCLFFILSQCTDIFPLNNVIQNMKGGS